MPSRLFALLAAFCLVAFPASSRSADTDKKLAPTLTIRVQPIDALLGNLKQLATLAGKGEEAKQIDGFIRARIGDNGLDGIDVKRPLGLYSVLTADLANSPTIAVVPIASEKDFLEMLQNFNMPATKGKDGVYTVTPEKVPISFHFRFANKSVYITAPDKSAVFADGNLIAPAALFTADDAATLSTTWNIAKVPQELKQIALSQLDLKFTDLQDKKEPGETESQRKFRVQTLKELSRQLAGVINEGSRLGVRLDLNAKDQVTADLSLSGRLKTKLADDIAALANKPSRFAALTAPGAALSLSAQITLPAAVRAALGPVVDEGIRKAIEGEQDEAKRKSAQTFLEALTPTLKAGEFTGGFRLVGPSPDLHYTLAAGVKLTDGAKVLAALRELTKSLRNTEQAMIKFDADKAGATPIHRLDAQKNFEEDAKRMLGENPLYFAIVDDAFLLTGGPDALDTLKALIAAKPAPAPLFHFEMALARLAPTMGKGTAADRKAVAKIAQDVFGTEGNDRVQFTLEGGKSLRARFAMKAPVVRFLAEVDKVTKKKEAKGDE